MNTPPSTVGARAELEVASACARAGMEVFVPWFCGHARVDLIVNTAHGPVRVQCKTGHVRGDAVVFRSCSNTKNDPRSYVGEIDSFGVYVPELDAVYLVPIDDVPPRVCHLRLAPARNGQRRGIRWAHEYRVLPPMVDALDAPIDGSAGRRVVGTMPP